MTMALQDFVTCSQKKPLVMEEGCCLDRAGGSTLLVPESGEKSIDKQGYQNRYFVIGNSLMFWRAFFGDE